MIWRGADISTRSTPRAFLRDPNIPGKKMEPASAAGIFPPRCTRERPMSYPAQYKAVVLNAIDGIDLGRVGEVIRIFQEARSHGWRIFICSDGGGAAAAARILGDAVKSVSFNRAERFRVMALNDELPRSTQATEDQARERSLVEQLKNFAEPGDLVVGITRSGDSLSVVRAIEYARWIGCATISIAGFSGGRLASLADVSVHVPATHPGSVEDAQSIICHMIGCYFLDAEAARKAG